MSLLYGNYRVKMVIFLLISYVVSYRFFNIIYIPLTFSKAISWLFYLCIFFFWFCSNYKYKQHWLLAIVFLVGISFFTSYFIYDQTLLQGRVSLFWFQLLFCYVLFYYKITKTEIFYSLLSFLLLWLVLWCVGYLSPTTIYSASGDYEMKYNASRGIVRMKLGGSDLCYLLGFWCLSLFFSFREKRYLCIFLGSFLVNVLSVSRQHIASFFLISLLYILYKVTWFKRVALMLFVVFVYFYVLPNVDFYNKMSELTEEQMEDDGEITNNIRYRAYDYFLTSYEQSFFTQILGHGIPHFDSAYGQKIHNLGLKYGYWLSDVGYARIYINFGVIGLMFFGYMFRRIYLKESSSENYGIKLFVFFVYCTTIASHELDVAVLEMSICLYILFFIKSNSYSSFVSEKCTENKS